MTNGAGLLPTLNPDSDPIRLVPTERLLVELSRRSTVRCLALVEQTEESPGVFRLSPKFSWGCQTNLAHETLGLLQQMHIAIQADAKSQFNIYGKGVDQFFEDRSREEREERESKNQPIKPYEYTPPGTPL